MAVYETSMSVQYQEDVWKLGDALREIVSNAIDGERSNAWRSSGKMSIKYSEETYTLEVKNEGITIEASALLLGVSGSKSREEAIGQFGEGLPMALLVFARNGNKVTIRNGKEKWEPEIRWSSLYRMNILAISTRQLPAGKNEFCVTVTGVNPDQYKELRERFLRLDESNPLQYLVRSNLSTDFGILTGSEQKGRVYVKGVLVQKRDDLLFGYNTALTLNRDRSIIDASDLFRELQDQLSAALGQAANEKYLPLIVRRLMMSSEQLETSSMYGTLRGNEKLEEAVLDYWQRTFGAETLAVTQGGEEEAAKALGLKAIVVSPLIADIVGRRFGDARRRADVESNKVAHAFEVSELGQRELRALKSMEMAMTIALNKPMSIRPAEFKGKKADGVWAEAGLMYVRLEDCASFSKLWKMVRVIFQRSPGEVRNHAYWSEVEPALLDALHNQAE